MEVFVALFGDSGRVDDQAFFIGKALDDLIDGEARPTVKARF